MPSHGDQSSGTVGRGAGSVDGPTGRLSNRSPGRRRSSRRRRRPRVAPLFMKNRGARNWFAAGRSAVTSCSKTAPLTSSTTRTQTEPHSATPRSSTSAPAGGDGEARAHVDERRRATGVVRHQLPAGVVPRWKPMPMQLTTALRAAWWRAPPSSHKEERHAGRLQRGERDPGDEGPAAEPGGIAAPAGEDAAPLVRSRVRRRRRGQPPAAHAGRERGGAEAERRYGADRRVRHAFGGDGRAGRRQPVRRARQPRCGCSEKSRPFERMASSQGWPARSGRRPPACPTPAPRGAARSRQDRRLRQLDPAAVPIDQDRVEGRPIRPG